MTVLVDDRDALRRLVAELRFARGLRALPPRVAWLHWRAHRLALRTGDRFGTTSTTRPADLALLLRLAGGSRLVVELGTGTAWTSLALAIADPQREVITFDPVAPPERERYLRLVDPAVLGRIRFVEAPGSTGPLDDRPVGLLYIDSSHARQDTIDELRAWLAVLAPGGAIVLDDYAHPDYPGVREAVRELALPGEQRGSLFVHQVPPRRP